MSTTRSPNFELAADLEADSSIAAGYHRNPRSAHGVLPLLALILQVACAGRSLYDFELHTRSPNRVARSRPRSEKVVHVILGSARGVLYGVNENLTLTLRDGEAFLAALDNDRPRPKLDAAVLRYQERRERKVV